MRGGGAQAGASKPKSHFQCPNPRSKPVSKPKPVSISKLEPISVSLKPETLTQVRNEEIRDAYLEAVCVDEVKKLALEVYEEEAGNEADHAAKVVPTS